MQVLDLQRNSLTELDFSYLTPSKADLMKVLARGFPKLQTLMAGEVGFVPQPSDIIALAKFCPAVQKFHLKADVTAGKVAFLPLFFPPVHCVLLLVYSSPITIITIISISILIYITLFSSRGCGADRGELQ